MRILLDTNVIVAAFFSHGACTELFEHFLQNHTIITSEFVLGEIRMVLQKKFNYSDKNINQVIQFIKNNSISAQYDRLKESVCRDSDDDNILATAIYGNVNCVVTVDKDLLILNSFENIPIITPKGFWEFEQNNLKN